MTVTPRRLDQQVPMLCRRFSAVVEHHRDPHGGRPPQFATFTGPAGTCHQRTELTSRPRDLLRTLKLAEPARFTRLDPAPAPANQAT